MNGVFKKFSIGNVQGRDRGLVEGLATLSVSTVLLIAMRLQLMGSKAPEFAPADNPAADCRWWLSRALTFLYLPVFNAWLLLQPSVLSFDWSMEAIPLITSPADARNLASAAFYSALVYAGWKSLMWTSSSPSSPLAPSPLTFDASSCLFQRWRWFSQSVALVSPASGESGGGGGGSSNSSSSSSSGSSSTASSTAGSLKSERWGTTTPPRWSQWQPAAVDSSDLLVLSVSVMVLPFIPATNLFFYVGFVVAERVLYIPSMGYCLLVAWGCHVIDDVIPRYRSPRAARTVFRCVLLALLAVYAARTVRRNHDWLTEESLYRSGININPPKGT